MGVIVRLLWRLIRSFGWMVLLALAWARRDSVSRYAKEAMGAFSGPDDAQPGVGERGAVADRFAAAGRSAADAGRAAASGVGTIASQLQDQIQGVQNRVEDRVGDAPRAAEGEAPDQAQSGAGDQAMGIATAPGGGMASTTDRDPTSGAAGFPDALDAVEDVKAAEEPTQAADETLAVQRELAERAPAGAGRMPESAPTSADVGASTAPEGSVRGDGSRQCPSDFPIKGNASSMIYHVPGTASYANTIAEVCFATTENAEAAGYHAPRR